MFKSWLLACVLGLVGMVLGRDALALREGGLGNEPMKDGNWRVGAVDVANLKSRVAFWYGPTSECQFLYRGDTAAFAEAIRLFGQIRAPKLELYLHDGPRVDKWLAPPLKDADPATAEGRSNVDWEFLIHDAADFHRTNTDRSGRLHGANAGKRLPAPRMDVYIGGGGIEWDKIRVPANVHVIDERVSSLGIKVEGGSIIRGVVYDQVTSKTVAGARIEVVVAANDEKRELEAAGQSDAEGKFQISMIPAGGYRVFVSADKYAPTCAAYSQLNGKDVATLSVDLAPAETMAGVLQDPAGKPVAGAKVSVYTATGIDGQGYGADRPTVTTDAQGRFEIAGLPRGYCELRFTAKGLHPIWPGDTFKTSAKDVVLRAGSAGLVKGRVISANGAPVHGGDVHVHMHDAAGMKVGTWGGTMALKEDGTFSFENVPVGSYVIAPKPIFLEGGAQPEEAKTIVVKPGQTVEVEFEVK